MNQPRCPEYREVTYLSSRGHPYTVLERVMPRLHDDILDSVIYLYDCARDARIGKDAGGSGFLVAIRADEGHAWLYAVTNDHVIKGGASVIRLNTVQGDCEVMEIPPGGWISHPKGDDVAACNLSFDSSLYKFKAFPLDQLITRERMQKTQIGPGDDTYLIGRFISHEGRQRNLPTVRSGIVSMMPWEKIDTRRGQKEGFLVEVKSIGGYSGSPVIVSVPVTRYSNNIPIPIGGPVPSGMFLLGIDCEHIAWREELFHKDKGKLIKTNFTVQSNTGMAFVVPAWKILDILNSNPLKEEREKDKEEMSQEESRATTVQDIAVSRPETQRTKTGLEIPVPTKRTVLHNLRKATRKKKNPS